MLDPRIETITDLLKKVKDLTGQLYEILAPEIISYEIVRGDLQRKQEDMKKLEDQKKVCLIEIENAKVIAESIKNMAKDESSVIIQNGKDIMIERMEKVNKLLAQVESFVPEMDKKRYMAMRKEAEKLQEKAA